MSEAFYLRNAAKTATPVLALPDFSRHFVVKNDMSTFAGRSVLSQRVE